MKQHSIGIGSHTSGFQLRFDPSVASRASERSAGRAPPSKDFGRDSYRAISWRH